MPQPTPLITPVSARLTYDDVHGTFRLKARVLKRDADGQEYEVMVEESLDLGATLNGLLGFFATGGGGTESYAAMAKPTAITIPALADDHWAANEQDYATAVVVGELDDDYDDTDNILDIS